MQRQRPCDQRDAPDQESGRQPAEQLTNKYVIIPHIAFTHNKFMYINREQQEHRVFKLLLQMVPGIEGRLTESSDEDVAHIAELVGFFTLCLQTLIPTLE